MVGHYEHLQVRERTRIRAETSSPAAEGPAAEGPAEEGHSRLLRIRDTHTDAASPLAHSGRCATVPLRIREGARRFATVVDKLRAADPKSYSAPYTACEASRVTVLLLTKVG